jgi:hypothetical protein
MLRKLIIIVVAVAVLVAGLAITSPWLYFVNREVNEASRGRTSSRRAKGQRGQSKLRNTCRCRPEPISEHRHLLRTLPSRIQHSSPQLEQAVA